MHGKGEVRGKDKRGISGKECEGREGTRGKVRHEKGVKGHTPPNRKSWIHGFALLNSCM